MKTLTINMKSDGTAEVLLYDDIGAGIFGGISAKQFREQVKAVKAKTLNLRINSGGGSVTEATAMMAALDEHPARIEVDIDGIAASAASVVAMAGDEIRIAADGFLMIHDPFTGVIGGADELRRTADLLDKAKGLMLDRYAKRAKASRDEIAAMMAAETWLTGAEAVESGFADTMTGALALAASVNVKELAARLGYRHVPQVLTARDEPAWHETRRRAAVAAGL